MNWMTPWGPVHFCQHELMLLMFMLPFVGGIIAWLRVKCKKQHKKCCGGEHDRHL